MDENKESGDAAAAVARMIELWNRACLQRDWDALLAMCNDDVVFMPPGANTVTGAGVRAWLDSFPTIKAMSSSVTQIDQNGGIAWLRGPMQWTLVIEGHEEHFDGKYCEVMRRGSDGRWRLSLSIWNSNQL